MRHVLTNLTKIKIAVLSIIALVLLIYIVSGFINPLQVTHYSYSSSKIPDGFEGFRIVQITDFHCKEFGDKESELIEAIKNEKPDLIVFTGDSIDGKHPIDNYRYLLEGIYKIAPIYYVTGNHEYDKYAPYEEMLELHKQYRIRDLNDTDAIITRNGSAILLSGMDYLPVLNGHNLNIDYANTTVFNMLLYHGTDRFDGIAPYHYDLVLSGHTHGGLICLPFIGGIITNEGELFPKYDSGVYTRGVSTMISSRGLGDAAIPRFHNPRELVSITLHHAD